MADQMCDVFEFVVTAVTPLSCQPRLKTVCCCGIMGVIITCCWGMGELNDCAVWKCMTGGGSTTVELN